MPTESSRPPSVERLLAAARPLVAGGAVPAALTSVARDVVADERIGWRELVARAKLSARRGRRALARSWARSGGRSKRLRARLPNGSQRSPTRRRPARA